MSQQINLFNPIFLKQKKYFSVVAMLQALLLIVVGGVLFYFYASSQLHQLAEQNAEASKRYASEEARLEKFKQQYSPQQARQQLENDVKVAETKLQVQQEIINTLKSGALGNTTGYSAYMRAFARQIVNGLWLTGFNIQGDATQLNLNGAVLSDTPELIPSYINRLGREEVMRGKSFAAMQIRKPQSSANKPAGYVEFSLQSRDQAEEQK